MTPKFVFANYRPRPAQNSRRNTHVENLVQGKENERSMIFSWFVVGFDFNFSGSGSQNFFPSFFSFPAPANFLPTKDSSPFHLFTISFVIWPKEREAEIGDFLTQVPMINFVILFFQTQDIAIRCIQKNVRKFMGVRNWPWWRLLVRLTPMLNVHRTEDQLKSRTVISKMSI